MTGFASFAVVDWSSGNDRGTKPKKDAIWIGSVLGGVAQDAVYCRNRDVAHILLKNLIKGELAAGRRLMIGFDFPFGYPRGFAAAVTGSSDPLALWQWIAKELQDTPKANNRFALAAKLNSFFPGVGPFWFNGTRTDLPDLPRKGRDRYGHGLPERREVEARAKGSFTCWQMGGAGSVGGQVMTGLAALHRLRKDFPEKIAVWPFECDSKPVHFVEIWPSLIDPIVKAADDPIRDRAQVRSLSRALHALPPARLQAMLDVEAPEEGWILGLGHEKELEEAACQS